MLHGLQRLAAGEGGAGQVDGGSKAKVRPRDLWGVDHAGSEMPGSQGR